MRCKEYSKIYVAGAPGFGTEFDCEGDADAADAVLQEP